MSDQFTFLPVRSAMTCHVTHKGPVTYECETPLTIFNVRPFLMAFVWDSLSRLDTMDLSHFRCTPVNGHCFAPHFCLSEGAIAPQRPMCFWLISSRKPMCSTWFYRFAEFSNCFAREAISALVSCFALHSPPFIFLQLISSKSTIFFSLRVRFVLWGVTHTNTEPPYRICPPRIGYWSVDDIRSGNQFTLIFTLGQIDSGLVLRNPDEFPSSGRIEGDVVEGSL